MSNEDIHALLGLKVHPTGIERVLMERVKICLGRKSIKEAIFLSNIAFEFAGFKKNSKSSHQCVEKRIPRCQHRVTPRLQVVAIDPVV
mmetsp:Transcript_25567/g.37161  ORF Transcript_25567/g.37161 Transcript_25567/m.37161 type:complete len:88 (-) Transcript_25567:88-351(-)